MRAVITIGRSNIARETEKAIALDFDAGLVWLPKSQVSVIFGEDGQLGRIEMPIWLARKNGLSFRIEK